MSERPFLITLCKQEFPGSNRSLRNLCALFPGSRHFVLSAMRADSPEITFLASYLREIAPPLVIFGSWAGTYSAIVDALTGRGTTFGVRWNSSSLQMGMVDETEKLRRVMTDERLSFVLFSHAPLAETFADFGDKTVYHVPEQLCAPPPAARRAKKKNSAVSFFSSPLEYRRKNVFSSLLALARVKIPHELHVNGLTSHVSYGPWLRDLGIPFVEHGWMSDTEYGQVLGRMDLGLQISVGEGFNYVCAEHMQRGIPVVGSSLLPVLRAVPERARQQLVVADPDDISEITDKINGLLRLSAVERDALSRDLIRSMHQLRTVNFALAKAALSDIRRRFQGGKNEKTRARRQNKNQPDRRLS